MKCQPRMGWVVLCTLIAALLIVACGDDSSTEEDDDDGGNDACEGVDLMIEYFHVAIEQVVGGVLGFDQIRICNLGNVSSGNFNYSIFLSTSPSIDGDLYLVMESDLNAGISGYLCQDYWAATWVPNVPEGNYYVLVLADPNQNIPECNESNNWAVSNESFHISP